MSPAQAPRSPKREAATPRIWLLLLRPGRSRSRAGAYRPPPSVPSACIARLPNGVRIQAFPDQFCDGLVCASDENSVADSCEVFVFRARDQHRYAACCESLEQVEDRLLCSDVNALSPVSYTHLTLPTIYSV